MDTGWLPLAAFILTAIGWLSREIWRWRRAKREATKDAIEILMKRKTLLQEMLNEIEDASQKGELCLQLDEVNTALLGLLAERLRRTLKEAGLPPEEALIAHGLSQLQPQQVTQLKGALEKVETLPLSDSTWDLLALGNAYYYAEQYQDAKDIYDRILELNPNNPMLLHNRGISYGQLGKYDEALADFNHALELRPDAPGTLINRGNAYTELARYDEALADLNRSLELDPDNPAAFNNRGNAYFRLKRYDEALADFNRSLELRPDDADTIHNRGTVYIKLGKYNEAFADLNHALELKPDDASTFYNLACLFSLWGKINDALAYLKKAIDKDEKYHEDAKTDEDFNNIREDPRFKKLIESD